MRVSAEKTVYRKDRRYAGVGLKQGSDMKMMALVAWPAVVCFRRRRYFCGSEEERVKVELKSEEGSRDERVLAHKTEEGKEGRFFLGHPSSDCDTGRCRRACKAWGNGGMFRSWKIIQ